MKLAFYYKVCSKSCLITHIRLMHRARSSDHFKLLVIDLKMSGACFKDRYLRLRTVLARKIIFITEDFLNMRVRLMVTEIPQLV